MELKVTKENFIGGNSFFVVKEQGGSTLVFKTETGIGAIDLYNSLAWESDNELYFKDINSYFIANNLREALLVLLGTCMYDEADRSLIKVTNNNLQECLLADVSYFGGIYIVDHPSEDLFEAYIGNNDACFKFSLYFYRIADSRIPRIKLESLWTTSGQIRTPMRLPLIVSDMVETGISLSRTVNSEVTITKMIDSIL